MTIDGLSPELTFRPESVAELSKILTDEKGTVVPVGSSTRQDFGNPLRRFDYALDLSRLNRVTEYVPADLTIHLEAGVRLGDLEHTLAENNQFLPLDPFEGPAATIGGIAATNGQGPYRAVGSIRDWIIGMKVVEANGTISKSGGRVVKNVTGYDLAKLYTGSIGTLAVIAEVSLKVRARFGRIATAFTRAQNVHEAGVLLKSIRSGPLQPVSLEWTGPENEVRLRLGEHPKAVDWQLKNLPPADWRIAEGAEQAAVWDSLRVKYSEMGPIIVKVIALPNEIATVIEELRPQAWIAHASNGIVLMTLAEPSDLKRIREKYRAVIERAPVETRRNISTFGLSAADYQLMRKMKNAFDPQYRLNPGRHVDGER